MYFIYSTLLLGALLLYAPFYWLRTRFLRRGRISLRERLGLGLVPQEGDGPSLWIHAVSVGEVLSLQSLVRELKRRHPAWRIYFSTLTDTGRRVAEEKIRDADVVFYVPLDFRGPVRRVLRALRPRLLVLAESEFWPNLLREAGRETGGVLLVNGRISQSAYKKYTELKPIAKRILAPVDVFLVQSSQDRDKLLEIGVPEGAVTVAGNLKSEIRPPDFSAEELRAFQGEVGIPEGAEVVIAGSTHRGEEEKLIAAFAAARRTEPALRFILAPRHIERAGEVVRLAQAAGLKVVRRTACGGDAWDMLVLDTMGELARFYALSDAAFIGGSLVDWGGQNLLEPAYYGKPVFFGPHMENFAILAEAFLERGGARVVKTDDDLAAMFLPGDKNERREMGARARRILDSLAGATEKTLAVIERMMRENERPERT